MSIDLGTSVFRKGVLCRFGDLGGVVKDWKRLAAAIGLRLMIKVFLLVLGGGSIRPGVFES